MLLVEASATEKHDWKPLRELLKSWEFTQNYAVAVGTAEGRLFLYNAAAAAVQELVFN